MTELDDFLTSLYDSFSEAEMQALQHGQTRLAELLESGSVPEDVSVPVYHASEVQVTLDVGLVAEETEEGLDVFVTEADEADASELAFKVDLFDLLEKEDLEAIGDEDRDDERDREGDRRDEKERWWRGRGEREYDVAATTPTIEVIEPIDREHRESLESAGITHLTDLVERDPEEIAEIIGDEEPEVSRERAAEWLDEARGLASILSDREADIPVELVDGIGPTFGRRLREHGYAELSDLATLSPDEISELTSTEDTTVSETRATEWLDSSETILEAMAELEETEAESAEDTTAGGTDASEEDVDPSEDESDGESE
ncbi:MAG: helix-hairpin-helix domain-containing protein [Halapricum sp.]